MGQPKPILVVSAPDLRPRFGVIAEQMLASKVSRPAKLFSKRDYFSLYQHFRRRSIPVWTSQDSTNSEYFIQVRREGETSNPFGKLRSSRYGMWKLPAETLRETGEVIVDANGKSLEGIRSIFRYYVPKTAGSLVIEPHGEKFHIKLKKP